MIALTKPDNIMAMPQKNNEWYTPARYIEAVRFVLGNIDLDPASCEFANRTIRADRYYTKLDNGLERPWYGKVWLNPPYGCTNGKSNIGLFTNKLLSAYWSGAVEQAILLSTSKTSTSWFSHLWQFPICFTDHDVAFDRPIQFRTPKKPHAVHFHGTIFVYLGPNEQRFIDIFSQFGTIAKRVSTPKQQPVNLSLWEVQA